MGFLAGFAALALTASASTAPQAPQALVSRAAELREAEAGSLAEVHATANGLLALLRTDAPEAAAIPWPEVAADLYAALERRGAAESASYLAWELGLALRSAGDLAQARELLLARVPALEGARDPGSALVHIELADLERYAARWRPAWGHLEEARVALVPQGVAPLAFEPPAAERERALALGTWFDVAGQYYLELGRSELAALYFAEQERRALALHDDPLWWGALDNHVRLAFAIGRLEAVVALAEEAEHEDIWRRGTSGDRAKLGFARARALLELELRGERERGQARELLLRVLEEPQVSEHDVLDAEILLATEALDARQPDEAREWLAAARARRVGRAEAEGASREAFALGALEMRLARAGTAEEARAALARGHEALARFLEAWAATPLLSGGVGFLQADWREQFLEEILLLERHASGDEGGASAIAEALLDVQACGSLTRAMEAPAVGLAEVRAALLVPGCGALLLVPGRSQSLALVLDGTTARVLPLAPAHVLRRARARFEEAVFEVLAGSTPAREAKLQVASRDAREVFLPDALWQWIRPWQEIVVVGAEGAGLFGLELLEPEAGQALGQIRAVSHAPSLPVAVALARARAVPPGGRGVVLVAPAEMGSRPGDLAPIPFDERHAEGLLALHGRARSRVLRGTAAALAALRGADFADHSAVTFVTHGLFDPARERPAGLLLANGEELWSEAIETLDMPALVSLVACGAARGPVGQGDDGRAGLGAAFLRAGAEAVVLGQADLELRMGLFLDQTLQARLVAGDSPAEALRRARAGVHAAGFGREAELQALLVRVVGLGTGRFFAEDTPNERDESGSAEGKGGLLAFGVLLLLGGACLVWACLGWRRWVARDS